VRLVHVLRLGVGTLLLAASLYAQNATPCPPRMSCWGQPPVTQDTGYAAFWQDLAKVKQEEAPKFLEANVGRIPVYYNKFPPGDTKYRDSAYGPLFPFGHGLSYTTFAYTGLEVRPTSPVSATVRIDVENTGRRTGDEVVQLYVREEYAPVVRPVRE
jgi:hypothetical protein